MSSHEDKRESRETFYKKSGRLKRRIFYRDGVIVQAFRYPNNDWEYEKIIEHYIKGECIGSTKYYYPTTTVTDDNEPDDEDEYDSVACRVEKVLSQLAEVSGYQGEVAIVERIDGATRQACATRRSGKKVIEITGLLASELDNDELAFVLAHEIAHHLNDHNTLYNAENSTSSKTVSRRLAENDARRKEAGHGRIRRAVGLLGTGIIELGRHHQHMLETSRTHEREADANAYKITKAAGFKPAAAEGALRKLNGGSLPDIGIFDELRSTHPNPADRARKARKE